MTRSAPAPTSFARRIAATLAAACLGVTVGCAGPARDDEVEPRDGPWVRVLDRVSITDTSFHATVVDDGATDGEKPTLRTLIGTPITPVLEGRLRRNVATDGRAAEASPRAAPADEPSPADEERRKGRLRRTSPTFGYSVGLNGRATMHDVKVSAVGTTFAYWLDSEETEKEITQTLTIFHYGHNFFLPAGAKNQSVTVNYTDPANEKNDLVMTTTAFVRLVRPSDGKWTVEVIDGRSVTPFREGLSSDGKNPFFPRKGESGGDLQNPVLLDDAARARLEKIEQVRKASPTTVPVSVLD